MDACSICKETIKKKTRNNKTLNPIKCIFCEKHFHAECLKMSESEIEIYVNSKNWSYNCDGCTDTKQFRKDVIEKLNSVIIKCDTQNKLLESQTIRIEEQSKSIVELQTVVKKLNKQQVGKRSYADTVLSASPSVSSLTASPSKRRKQDQQNEPILIVKPKKKTINMEIDGNADNTTENQIENNIKLKELIEKTVNPYSDPVKTCRQTARGNVVIQCNNHAAIETIKKKLTEKAGNDIEVTEPKSIDAVVRIIGFQEEFADPDTFIDSLVKQNKNIFDQTSLIEVVDIKPRYNGTYAARVKINTETMSKLLNAERVNIGWSRCVVYEHLNIGRCYKCNMYGHMAEKCTSKTDICCKCAGEHKTKDCTSNYKKCINCTTAKEKLGLQITTDHYVWSAECSSMQYRLRQKQKFIRYTK